MSDARKAAAARLGLETVDGKPSLSKQSMLSAVGGWLGVVDAILPSTVFVTAFTVSKELVPSVVAAGIVSLTLLIIQLIRKRPIANALVGAAGIAIAAYLPLRDGGQPADYFLQGFFTNSIYLFVISVSWLIRWPIIGVLVGLLTGRGSQWRQNKTQMRRFSAATLIWVGLFAGRLLVQVPLYFAGSIEALGIARVSMGVPLYAICIWLTWLTIRSEFADRQ